MASNGDVALREQIEAELAEWERRLREEIAPTFRLYHDDQPEAETKADLEQVKKFYLQRRYLLRIRENIRTFAAR